MHPLDEFKRDMTGHLPGLLVLFDIADAKRRNCHLGHLTVDKDIDEMNELVRISVGPDGLARRVGGDEWLAIYKTDSLKPFTTLLGTYYREQEIRVGWKATGEKDGSVKVAERIVSSKIIRSLRCIYTFATSVEDAGVSVEKLLDHNYGLPPNIPIPLSDIADIKKSGWSCVTDYPVELPFCPFCEGRDFTWIDGDSSVYSGWGTCRACGANVDIVGVENSI